MQEFRIRVVMSRPRQICLEPWGDELQIPADVICEVVARGPESDTLEMHIGDDEVVIYGWPGSIVEVLRGGRVIGPAKPGDGEAGG